jgi:hypothetical protein
MLERALRVVDLTPALQMRRNATASGQETSCADARPSTRGSRGSVALRRGEGAAATPSSAAAPAMLSAVSPQQAWREQLKSANAAEPRAVLDGKWAGAAKAGKEEQEARQQPRSRRANVTESSVDRILQSSIKQHTYAYAPNRQPLSLEVSRSPYELSARGFDEPVQIRRDVKDSVGVDECARRPQL